MPKRKRRSSSRQSNRRTAKPRAGASQGADDKSLRKHVLFLLRGGGAHLDLEKALAGIPPILRARRVEGVPYSIWSFIEHLRIAQWDILEFSRNAKHVSPEWPSGYWPIADAPADDAAWQTTLDAFRRDLKEMEKLVENPRTNLHAAIPHGQGQTILREALLVADHNAYHLGQIIMLRRLLGAWNDATAN